MAGGVFLRQLEYLTALARERHFGRAAEACHVSQPALSAAIRKLESELGLTLVQRDQRYDDLTPEGRALLRWAQQAQASIDGLAAEAARLRQDLSGRLRLGVIPTALPAVARITSPLLQRHPDVRLEVRALSSIEIGRRLASYDIDAGITYLDNEPLGAVAGTPVYRERYVFLSADDDWQGPSIEWRELANVPLCLLTPDMQNRRIVNGALHEAGVEPTARVEANSVSALLSFASAGWSCVTAHTWLTLHGLPAGMRAFPLVAPEVTHEIGLVTPETDLPQPVVRALCDALDSADVDVELDRAWRMARGPAPA
jgi:DNA-binding transcriptional LysR family regulator